MYAAPPLHPDIGQGIKTPTGLDHVGPSRCQKENLRPILRNEKPDLHMYAASPVFIRTSGTVSRCSGAHGYDANNLRLPSLGSSNHISLRSSRQSYQLSDCHYFFVKVKANSHRDSLQESSAWSKSTFLQLSPCDMVETVKLFLDSRLDDKSFSTE
ncbi:hypothetical protein ANN_25839 [Periplaneta americana]|uniref:Uncharacterized protein n=1 Tax=Periplaneta americana TaxID=6978 RepID=A0ABQ8S4A0_PERAM|nr:hypothetical protein ANN_25839 [Periplaneta americana]